MSNRSRTTLRNAFEFLPAWIVLKTLGMLPRKLAISVGRLITRILYLIQPRRRQIGERNLAMAFPDLSESGRRAIVRQVFANIGRLLGEFSQFPKLSRREMESLVEYDGFEHYKAAADQKRGVLLLTGHVGSWSFVHSRTASMAIHSPSLCVVSIIL